MQKGPQINSRWVVFVKSALLKSDKWVGETLSMGANRF